MDGLGETCLLTINTDLYEVQTKKPSPFFKIPFTWRNDLKADDEVLCCRLVSTEIS